MFDVVCECYSVTAADAACNCIRCRWLLEQAGANPSVQTKDGETSLHIASKYGHTACVDLLLAYGAAPAIKDVGGKTPSDVACVYYHQPDAKVKAAEIKARLSSPAAVAFELDKAFAGAFEQPVANNASPRGKGRTNGHQSASTSTSTSSIGNKSGGSGVGGSAATSSKLLVPPTAGTAASRSASRSPSPSRSRLRSRSPAANGRREVRVKKRDALKSLQV